MAYKPHFVITDFNRAADPAEDTTAVLGHTTDVNRAVKLAEGAKGEARIEMHEEGRIRTFTVGHYTTADEAAVGHPIHPWHGIKEYVASHYGPPGKKKKAPRKAA